MQAKNGALRAQQSRSRGEKEQQRGIRKILAKSKAFKVQRSLLRRGMGVPNRTMQRNVIK
ncbi:hypothetical protein A5N82_05315 [Christensenella minuta]|uniref:Uncharacterized protein n=1 Tax=Christensenella minuta TaxID=626937 RepID=A0A136Q534_9FIRM|nr:hypothetical protein B1H56_12305 [Christensenella minuta]KXK65762.1 hypothetical protein HMPREF3293_01365 [Christensenella minuta]OAQ40104.1 hypothetical protein A5N82_05315 [Christensenella minuta]